MVQDALVIFITYVIYYLVCDSNCKTCAAAATTCTTCNDGYDLAVDKCNVTPVDPGTGSNSTGNGTGN